MCCAKSRSYFSANMAAFPQILPSFNRSLKILQAMFNLFLAECKLQPSAMPQPMTKCKSFTELQNYTKNKMPQTENNYLHSFMIRYKNSPNKHKKKEKKYRTLLPSVGKILSVIQSTRTIIFVFSYIHFRIFLIMKK